MQGAFVTKQQQTPTKKMQTAENTQKMLVATHTALTVPAGMFWEPLVQEACCVQRHFNV